MKEVLILNLLHKQNHLLLVLYCKHDLFLQIIEHMFFYHKCAIPARLHRSTVNSRIPNWGDCTSVKIFHVFVQFEEHIVFYRSEGASTSDSSEFTRPKRGEIMANVAKT